LLYDFLFRSPSLAHLTERGLLLKEGSLIDATIIAAPTSTKNRDRQRDPERHQVKKGRASIRAKVEHPFHIIKNTLGLKKVRYRGLAKNHAQLFTLFGLANLLIARRRLMFYAQGAS
jgi:hypothetical protein